MGKTERREKRDRNRPRRHRGEGNRKGSGECITCGKHVTQGLLCGVCIVESK